MNRLTAARVYKVLNIYENTCPLCTLYTEVLIILHITSKQSKYTTCLTENQYL